MPKQRKIKHYSFGYMSRRRRRGRILKVIAFLAGLAVLIFLGYCAAMAVVNLSDREHSSQEESSVAASLPKEESAVSQTPESSEEPEPSGGQTASADIRAVMMPEAALSDPQALEDFLQGLDPASCNTVAVELKDAAGYLSYASEVQLAAASGAILAGAITLEELEALASAIEDAGFTPAAYIYALQDDIASHASYGTSYLYEDQAGVTWLDQAADNGGRSWLNPYMEAAVEYLGDLSAEIAGAGFDEIFAAGIQYPDTRYPAQMGYGPNASSMTLTEALQNVLDTMNSRAAVSGAEVIPVFEGSCYLGENDSLYNGSPDTLQTEKAAPILESGRETEILAAIQLPEDQLIPVVTSEEQISALEAAGVRQYLLLGE